MSRRVCPSRRFFISPKGEFLFARTKRNQKCAGGQARKNFKRQERAFVLSAGTPGPPRPRKVRCVPFPPTGRRKLHSLPCSSSPHKTRFAGLLRGSFPGGQGQSASIAYRRASSTAGRLPRRAPPWHNQTRQLVHPNRAPGLEKPWGGRKARTPVPRRGEAAGLTIPSRSAILNKEDQDRPQTEVMKGEKKDGGIACTAPIYHFCLDLRDFGICIKEKALSIS